MLTKEFINPHPMGFTNTVAYTARGIKTIVVSGQVGYADGKFGETFEEQAEMAHRNLVEQLAAAGAGVVSGRGRPGFGTPAHVIVTYIQTLKSRGSHLDRAACAIESPDWQQ